MGWNLKKAVALVGMMGAGKTAVGKALAAELDVPFLDSDSEIEKAANMKVAEIFSRDGEAFFRQKETQVISRLLDRPDKCVLSTGGGAFLAPANRQMISDKGLSVCLQADVALLWSRVRHKQTRPLLQTDNPRATLEQLVRDRGPIYALADLTVQARPEYSIDDMMRRVLDALLTRPDVLEKT